MYAKKIILHCPNGYKERLDALIRAFIKDKVIFVAVVGKDCSKIEDIIDELCVSEELNADDGSSVFMLTSSHPDESIEEVVEFAKSLTGEYAGDNVQVVRFE